MDDDGEVAPCAVDGPFLTDGTGRFRLRPWIPSDAPSLVAAWSVPDIARRSRPPGERSRALADRWIAGAELRRATGLVTDLVIAPPSGPEVWGEVGLVRRRWRGSDGSPERTVWELGWWVLPAHRGRGLAEAASTVLGGWAGPALGLAAWVARIEPGNVASQRVATRLGLEQRGRFDDHHDLWSGPLPASARDGTQRQV